MSNIAEFLTKSTGILQQSGIADARREANSLLAFYLKKDQTFLFAHPEHELTETDESLFFQLVQRRANREPFQYITGQQEFYGLDFEVSEGVLIPRPETELIVENAIEILKKVENPRFCEVGTGSGCISVSILYHLQNAVASGLDISAKALEITKRNAIKHKVADRLNLKDSDVFSALNKTKYDLIVSNPPYVSKNDYAVLQPEVKEYEPNFALTDGKDGLSIIERIILESPTYLKPTGFLLLEIGFGQAEQVKAMFLGDIWRIMEILPDLQGIPRTVKAQIK
jgi:release factor glutamine methyltransferase